MTVVGNLLFCFDGFDKRPGQVRVPGKRFVFTLVMITLTVAGSLDEGQLVGLEAKPTTDDTTALILPFRTSPLGVFMMRQYHRR